MAPAPGREDQPLPERIGRFEVVGRLGAGGMGQVLRARDPQLGREVAIKVLHADIDVERAPLQAEVARRRLLREAQAMARLDHPNVIGVHEVGEDGGRVFLVMERVSGATLAGWLSAAPRAWREVLAVFAQVGAGLAAAHAAGMVHRDIKPDNILVGDDGRVRVTDFGLVGVDGPTLPAPASADDVDPTGATSESLPPALTHEGALVGTPGYMAPEQVRGQGADARSDQFGLCVTLYEALFHQPPFVGGSYRERMIAVLDGHVQLPPAATEVPPPVIAVVLRGLTVEADARWPDVPALCRALDLAANAPPAPPAPEPELPPMPPVTRPRRGWRLAAAAVIVAGGGLGTWRLTRPRDGAGTPWLAALVPAMPRPPAWPLPAAAVETLIHSGACDDTPVVVDDHTLVYHHADRTGLDLRVRDLVTGADRALTTTPDVDEMSVQPAIGERAVIALPRKLSDSGAGPSRIDLDTGLVTPLPGGSGIAFGPGAISANGALYYVLGAGAAFMELRDGVASERASYPGYGIAAFTVDPRGDQAALFLGGAACMVDLHSHAEPHCSENLRGPYGRVALDDADRVYYAGDGGLYRRDPATDQDVLLVADRGANGGLAVSAAGDVVYFSECQPQIEITAIDDGSVVHAESLTRAQRNRFGAWVFIRELPSSSLLAYLDPGGLVQILTSASQGTATEPALEPDGERIVFYLAGGAQPGFYLAWGQSHRPIRLLSKKQFGAPVWIDEQHVAATFQHADGLPYLHILDLDTGEDRQALPRPRVTADHQPDGRQILLLDEGRARLFLWDPVTGKERELRLPADVSHRFFLHAALGAGARTVDVRIGPQVWTVPIDPPGPARKTYMPPDRKDFWGEEIGPDDRRYMLVSENKGDLYRLRLPR